MNIIMYLNKAPERTKVISAYLHFEAVLGPLQGACHDACVQNEEVQTGLLLQLRADSRHARQIGQVQLEHLDGTLHPRNVS